MCEKTRYAVESLCNVLLSECLFGESWNLIFLGRFMFSARFGHSSKYYPPIIAVSHMHFAKVFSLQNFVSHGMPCPNSHLQPSHPPPLVQKIASQNFIFTSFSYTNTYSTAHVVHTITNHVSCSLASFSFQNKSNSERNGAWYLVDFFAFSIDLLCMKYLASMMVKWPAFLV